MPRRREQLFLSTLTEAEVLELWHQAAILFARARLMQCEEILSLLLDKLPDPITLRRRKLPYTTDWVVLVSTVFRTWYNLGIVHAFQGEWWHAGLAFKNAVRVCRRSPLAHFALAVVRFKQGLYMKAECGWQKAIVLLETTGADFDCMDILDLPSFLDFALQHNLLPVLLSEKRAVKLPISCWNLTRDHLRSCLNCVHHLRNCNFTSLYLHASGEHQLKGKMLANYCIDCAECRNIRASPAAVIFAPHQELLDKSPDNPFFAFSLKAVLAENADGLEPLSPISENLSELSDATLTADDQGNLKMVIAKETAVQETLRLIDDVAHRRAHDKRPGHERNNGAEFFEVVQLIDKLQLDYETQEELQASTTPTAQKLPENETGKALRAIDDFVHLRIQSKKAGNSRPGKLLTMPAVNLMTELVDAHKKQLHRKELQHATDLLAAEEKRIQAEAKVAKQLDERVEAFCKSKELEETNNVAVKITNPTPEQQHMQAVEQPVANLPADVKHKVERRDAIMKFLTMKRTSVQAIQRLEALNTYFKSSEPKLGMTGTVDYDLLPKATIAELDAIDTQFKATAPKTSHRANANNAACRNIPQYNHDLHFGTLTSEELDALDAYFKGLSPSHFRKEEPVHIAEEVALSVLEPKNSTNSSSLHFLAAATTPGRQNESINTGRSTRRYLLENFYNTSPTKNANVTQSSESSSPLKKAGNSKMADSGKMSDNNNNRDKTPLADEDDNKNIEQSLNSTIKTACSDVLTNSTKGSEQVALSPSPAFTISSEKSEKSTSSPHKGNISPYKKHDYTCRRRAELAKQDPKTHDRIKRIHDYVRGQNVLTSDQSMTSATITDIVELPATPVVFMGSKTGDVGDTHVPENMTSGDNNIHADEATTSGNSNASVANHVIANDDVFAPILLHNDQRVFGHSNLTQSTNGETDSEPNKIEYGSFRHSRLHYDIVHHSHHDHMPQSHAPQGTAPHGVVEQVMLLPNLPPTESLDLNMNMIRIEENARGIEQTRQMLALRTELHNLAEHVRLQREEHTAEHEGFVNELELLRQETEQIHAQASASQQEAYQRGVAAGREAVRREMANLSAMQAQSVREREEMRQEFSRLTAQLNALIARQAAQVHHQEQQQEADRRTREEVRDQLAAAIVRSPNRNRNATSGGTAIYSPPRLDSSSLPIRALSSSPVRRAVTTPIRSADVGGSMRGRRPSRLVLQPTVFEGVEAYQANRVRGIDMRSSPGSGGKQRKNSFAMEMEKNADKKD